MKHILLKFSRIGSVAYSNDAKMLEVKFNDGTTLQYLDVPSTVYFSLINAYSHDSYFEKYIAPVYKYIRKTFFR